MDSKRRSLTTGMLTLCIAIVTSSQGLSAERQFPAEQLEYFEKQVRPLLAEHCYACHSAGADKVRGGLLVDSRSALLEGGDSGAALIPGDDQQSLLLEAVRYESYEMPPSGKLPEKDIQVLEHWVNMGAHWPQEVAPTRGPDDNEFDLLKRKAEHWVWQPIQSPPLPPVRDERWPKSELDYFILERLEDSGLRPTPDADRTALVRRIYFDLIGLPPSAEQAATFVDERSPEAIQRLVGELLSSPHFGERWGRHWLDVVRYAESRGHEFDNDAPNAFQYRDYVIRALNADVPYDQFVREHIAGDLLEQPRLHPQCGYNESILGTGFWHLGEWVHSPVDVRKDESDRFDNMIDVMSKAFLGVTVSCARCHDHKFDAISTADYYSLSGFLQGSDYRQVRFESMEANRQVAEQLDQLDQQYQQELVDELKVLGIQPPSDADSKDVTHDSIVMHCGTLTPDEYLQDGYIFGKQPRRVGTPVLAKVDDRLTLHLATRASAASDPFWYGLESVAEQGQLNQSKLTKLSRSGRTLRTPTFELQSAEVACRVHGSGHVFACVDSHRLVAGPLHGETIAKIEPGQRWVTLHLGRYVGHRVHLEFTPTEDSQLEVTWITQGASEEVLKQLAADEQHVASVVEGLNDEIKSQLAHDSVEFARLRGLVESWARQRESLQEQVVRRSSLAMAMMDGTGEDDHVLIRGNSSKPGQLEPRHFLTAVSGDQPMKIRRGSGRLELAKHINDPTNPLTARVIVNRIWHHLLGRGIVPTTDDFGVLGQRPTHPELLDHLATKFLEDGQSLKLMIRYIMLSRTYQMSSQADALAVQQDPKNLLWHHRPPKRLEGEAIRDALLTISGKLNTQQFGEPVPVHLTSFMSGRGRPNRNGPLDGEGRRSIYIAVRRNFLSPFMLTFDTPVPFSSMGRRNVSNVPAQALILMNDPLVVEQARNWAQRTIDQSELVEDRVRWMYQMAFARLPKQQELETATAYFDSTPAEHSEIDIWADYAHALINTKEFIFLR